MHQPVTNRKENRASEVLSYRLGRNILILLLVLITSTTLLGFLPGIKTVPFKGTLVTTFQVSGELPIQTIQTNGTGETTHLGNTTFHGDVLLDNTVDPPYSTGIATFTAANGDSFQTNYEGAAHIVNNLMTGELRHTIIVGSGTGRFENISGSFTAYVTNNLATSTGSQKFEGEITY